MLSFTLVSRVWIGCLKRYNEVYRPREEPVRTRTGARTHTHAHTYTHTPKMVTRHCRALCFPVYPSNITALTPKARENNKSDTSSTVCFSLKPTVCSHTTKSCSQLMVQASALHLTLGSPRLHGSPGKEPTATEQLSPDLGAI